MQFGALSASLRLHSCGDDLDRRPWLWGAEHERAMRIFFHLRSRLMPYIYTSVRQCHDRMLPLLRPMYLGHPDRQQAYEHPGQYLFGDNLLVAPIVAPGRGKRCLASTRVWFPEGSWFNFFAGQAKRRAYRLELPGTSRMEDATVSGRQVQVSYDESRRMNVVTVEALPLRCVDY